MGKEAAGAYLESLFRILARSADLEPAERDRVWIAECTEAIEEGFREANLPRLLALIHPDFYYRGGKPIASSLPWRSREFSDDIMMSDRCQAVEYTGVECVFNHLPRVRGKCEADHRWPNSLGGPSVLDNRLILCRFHNSMKSNDVFGFDWATVPSWLEGYLTRMLSLKR